MILSTILPVFLVIFLGWVVRKQKFIPDEFIGPANQLVYYIAIPAMIFRAVASASVHEVFDITLLGLTLSTVFITFAATWLATTAAGISLKTKGTFVQSAFHGNLGYIGLAVVFYYLGAPGLASAGIFAGFIMIFQNILAICVLQVNGAKANHKGTSLLANIRRILVHPVILASVSGILVSSANLPIPLIAERTLDIISGMALPLALLLIGATLSFEVIRTHLARVAWASLIKLIAMPGVGLLLFQCWAIPREKFLPVFILLCAPSATLTYVMAKEMKGDTEFAVAVVSACTMLSALGFGMWLHFLS